MVMKVDGCTLVRHRETTIPAAGENVKRHSVECLFFFKYVTESRKELHKEHGKFD